MKVVIDSSILIDHLRGGTKWQDFLLNVSKDTTLFISSIVYFELFSGQSSKKSEVTKDILNLLSKFKRIEIDEKIARQAGELFRDIGSHIDSADYIITASSRSINGAILTLNEKHFRQIPGTVFYPV